MKGIAKRFCKPQSPIHFDEKELKTNLGEGNFIFVGSSNDLFARGVPAEWIIKTLNHCNKFNNTYFFQTKNPLRFSLLLEHPIAKRAAICTTIETNVHYCLDIMGNAPDPLERSIAISDITEIAEKYVTIEPIMNFHLDRLVMMIKQCSPKQVNIGADSGKNRLPEPRKEKVLKLIAALEEFTIVKQKSNLSRILK